MAPTQSFSPAADPEPTVANHPAAPPLLVDAFGRTDPGLVRENNEDHFAIAELAKIMRVNQSSLPGPGERTDSAHAHLFVVADGMGGHAGGEVASQIAVNTVEECLLDSLKWFLGAQGAEGDEVAKSLRAAVEVADREVFNAVDRRPALHRMGSTLTLAFHHARELFVAHVGDSRAYLCRGGGLHRLTRDHTLFAELTRLGRPPAAAAAEQMRHVVTNVVGGVKAGVKADIVRVALEPGDRLLLCTDGLTDMLTNAEIAAALAEHPQPEAACRQLVALANERGGRDNITAVLAVFREIGD
jgi:serine/threonine protein phosphatase PrpC